MKIELKKLKHYERLSEETNAFSADLYADGNFVATCRNDGRGGPIDFDNHGIGVDKSLLGLCETYCKSLPPVVFEYGDNQKSELPMNLELFVGDLVEESLRSKELLKFRKRMEKDFLKYICYGTETSYRSIGWKNYTIAQLIGTPVGNKMIQTRVDVLKEKGETILNTNLTGINI